MMQISVTVSGVDGLMQDLRRMDRSQRRRVQIRALSAGAHVVEGYAKVNCPVDTGFLRNSITVDTVTEDEAIIAPHTDYAEFVEMGTSRQGAQPYMRPAVDQHERDITQAVAAELRAGIG